MNTKTMLSVQSLYRFAGAVLLCLLPACSFHPNQAVLQPVGPPPQANLNPEHEGYLVVYSAWSNFVDQGSIGHHSRYTIASDDGKVSREIINHTDRFDEGPVRLALAPGSYRVRARSAHFGRVNVPVLIKERETTFVYLDGSSHPEAPSARQSNAVKLPDGEIVGWSTTAAAHN
jgi:hypothetical protein